VAPDDRAVYFTLIPSGSPSSVLLASFDGRRADVQGISESGAVTRVVGLGSSLPVAIDRTGEQVFVPRAVAGRRVTGVNDRFVQDIWINISLARLQVTAPPLGDPEHLTRGGRARTT
jgi:hypothetical protein